MVTHAELLFVEHKDRLFLYFCRAVGHADTARDLTQDVFLRVARRGLPTTEAPELRAWLFRIARNLALDHHRRLARRPDERANAGAPDVHLVAAPASAGHGQETTVALNEALARLEDLDRDVFLMREVGGLSYDEIGHACALTPDAVRSRIHRTRLRLREHLSASIHDTTLRPMRMMGGPK